MKIKVNEKNMWNVSGKINKFLSKKCVENLGLCKVSTGETFSPEWGIKIPIYEDKVVHRPILGICEEHHVRKNALERIKSGEEYHDDKARAAETLLAIMRKFDSSCIPICNGNVVEFKGNRIIIHTNLGHGCKYKTELIQEEYSEKEQDDFIKRQFVSLFSDQLYEYDYWIECYENRGRTMRSCLNDIISFTSGISIDLTNSAFECIVKFDNCYIYTDKEVKMIIDFVSYKKTEQIKVEYYVDDKVYSDLEELLLAITNDDTESDEDSDNDDYSYYA